MPVFIAIADIEGVMPARDYQAHAYNTFMNDVEDPASKEFTYKDKGKCANIVFKIVKFDKSGLSGTYPSFCSLLSENGQCHILSNDKESLSAFHGFRTRLTMIV